MLHNYCAENGGSLQREYDCFVNIRINWRLMVMTKAELNKIFKSFSEEERTITYNPG